MGKNGRPVTEVSYCRWCGQATGRCSGECRPPGSDEAPRFCPVCRRKLTVYVTLGYFAARCRDHGEV